MRTDDLKADGVRAATTDATAGNGWRRRLLLAPRGGSWALRLVALAAVIGAAAWALYSNVWAAKPTMDMSVRVISSAASFPVTSVPVEVGAVTGAVSYTGSVAPFNEEDVYPRVTGRIVEMPVYPGDAVRAGQVVARLDDVELTSKVREAEAMAATAQANRAQMEADLLSARYGIAQMERELAMVEAELTYARGVAGRSERLVASGAISRQEYENDRSMAASLDAKREAAQAKLEQARTMEAAARKKVDAADSMVAQGRAALRTATVVRDYVTIQSPTGGYVVKRLVAPGVLVQPGMAILKIAQIDRVRLQANVGEKDLAQIKVGSLVVVTALGARAASLTTRVTSVFPFVDPGARTAIVEAVVDNRDRRLLPGQYVQMQFVSGEQREALSVPRSAVSRLGGKARVWVVEDGRAQPREVQTGLENPERVQITAGLRVNDRVISRGHEALYAGARVAEARVQEPAPSSGAAPAVPDKPMPDMPGMSGAPAQPKERGHAGH